MQKNFLVYRRQEQLPGNMGLAKEAEIFSQTWQALTRQFYQRSVVMKIYQLTAVQRVCSFTFPQLNLSAEQVFAG